MERITMDGLTYDDVLLLPAKSDILPSQANVATDLGKGLILPIPLVAAAMDTVTEHKLAIALAREGGMGFIHKNMSIQEQAAEVRRVKLYEEGVVRDPAIVSSDTKISEVVQKAKDLGFYTFPVVDKDNKLEGMITKRDVIYVTDQDTLVKDVMIGRENVVVITRQNGESSQYQSTFFSTSLPFTKEEVISKMVNHKVAQLPVVNEDDTLAGLITHSGLVKLEEKPSVAKDSKGSLRCGGAIGCGEDKLERAKALVEAGVDALLVDSSHGHSEGVLSTIKLMRNAFPNICLIGGNICTADGAVALADAGADVVKCGVGSGSICTTRIVTGVGSPQFAAVSEAVRALKDRNVAVIADGGTRYSGVVAKALAAGASAVMVGSLLAGTAEAPGEIEYHNGRPYKSYRGMGSIAAMEKGSADRYFQSKHASPLKLVPEGIEGRVPFKGPLDLIVHQLVGGLKSSMGLTGCKDLLEFRTKSRFIRITPATVIENHPHDVIMTQDAPNYKRPRI